MKNNSKDIIFAISAGAEYGLGHLMRCSVLARECLRRGMNIGFILRGDQSAENVLKNEVPGVDWLTWSDYNIEFFKTDILVFDTKLDIKNEVASIDKNETKVIVIDKLLPDIDAVDLFILPTIDAYIPEKLIDKVLCGPEYVIISEVFTSLDKLNTASENKSVILIAMGGSDPLDSTSMIMEACSQMRDVLNDRIVKIIIGPSNARAEKIKKKALQYGMEFVLSPDQSSYRDCLLQSLIVFAGFGISVYEIAHLNIPCLYVTHYREDCEDAKRLEALGLGRLLGYGPDISTEDIKESLISVLNQRDFSDKVMQNIFDGNGAKRILDKLANIRSVYG